MLVYGKQVVLYILNNHKDIIQKVYFNKKVDKKLFKQFSALDKEIIILDNKKAQALAKGGNHQGFFLEIDEILPIKLKSIKDYNYIVVLDSLTDMGNIGSIFRSAYSLGVEAIVITGITNPKIENILRSSSGAMVDLPFCVVNNILDVANELGQYKFELIGADMKGVDIKTFQTTSKKALFLGNEGYGLSKKVLPKLTHKVKINTNRFDSLNVSVAGAILMYELATI